MADAKEHRIRGYYSELKKFVENQNYSKVVKVANKIITEVDTEVKAWQCRLTAQIHLGEFKDGIESLKKCKVAENLVFEKAYCEYRLNRTSEAWKTIANAPSDSTTRIKELQAQILYRLERYDECFAIYRDLVKTTSDQFDQERLTNLAAVSVNRIYGGCKERGPKPGSDSTYEQLYNNACEILSLGQTQDALKRLQDTEALCRKTLTLQEGASEEEINEEVAIIRVQQGHCLQLLGREKEALSLYNSVLKTKPDDAALLAIISNNIVAINREGNVFDSKKRLKATSAPGLEHKLTSRQRGILALNHCLLAYHTNQEDVIESEINQITKNFPLQWRSVVLVKAAQVGRAGKLEEVVRVLKSYANDHPDDALLALLSAAQILLSHGDLTSTIEILLSLDEKQRFCSGIVSALVVLCSATRDVELASKVLRESVEWHKKNKSSASHVSELWRQAANFHLRNGDPRTAAASLQELRNLEPLNMNTLAQLISAYSQFDAAMAQELSQELPDPSSLVSNIDAEALDTAFGLKYTKKPVKDLSEASPATPKSGKAGSTPDAAKERRKQRKKKRRQVRLPKDYIIGEEPDPERWLPRWQRKTYKKKRRNKEVMRGTQGVSSDATDKFDITKTSGQQKPQVASPKPESGYKRNFAKKKGVKKKKGTR